MSAKRKRRPARSNPGSTARPRSVAGHNPAVDSKPATRDPKPASGHAPAVTIGTAVFSQGLEGHLSTLRTTSPWPGSQSRSSPCD